MFDERIGRQDAKAAARRRLRGSAAGVRVLGAPQKASPALGVKRPLPFQGEDRVDALLRETARQENAALKFPEPWEFLKQAHARKNARRARMVRSFGAVAACLVIAAAGIVFFRGQQPSAPNENMAPMTAAAPPSELRAADALPSADQSGSSSLCALPQESAPEVSAQSGDAGAQKDATSESGGLTGGAGLAPGAVASFETREIGQALHGADVKNLRDQNVAVEYGMLSPVPLEIGEAAVCGAEDGSLALYYRYNGEDTLRLTQAGADTETLFGYARQLAQ